MRFDCAGHVDVAQNNAAENGARRIGIAWQKRYPDRGIGVGVHSAILDCELSGGKPSRLPIADFRLASFATDIWQSAIANVNRLAHPLPRGGNELTGPAI